MNRRRIGSFRNCARRKMMSIFDFQLVLKNCHEKLQQAMSTKTTLHHQSFHIHRVRNFPSFFILYLLQHWSIEMHIREHRRSDGTTSSLTWYNLLQLQCSPIIYSTDFVYQSFVISILNTSLWKYSFCLFSIVRYPVLYSYSAVSRWTFRNEYQKENNSE